MKELKEKYMRLNAQEIEEISNIEKLNNYLISEQNYQERKHMRSNLDNGVLVRPGDICYIDFGKAYQYEVGFQHFGLVIAKYNNKIFVAPMTSKKAAFSKAKGKDKLNGSRHLLRFRKVGNMKSDSVIFLNDTKFINSARVIDVKAHISVNSELFKYIKSEVQNIIFN